MKKIVLAVLILTHCIVHAQRKPKIKGNRSVIEVIQDLPDFNAVELNDDLAITLSKSVTPGYVINADDNLIDILKFEVRDSTLVISSFYTITAKKQLDITVNYRELESITMREGQIGMVDIINTDRLYVNTFGASKLQLNADASIMDLNMEGSSSGDFNLDIDSLSITLRDKIKAEIYSVSEKNTVEARNNASFRMEGTTDTLQIKLMGNTNARTEKLEAATVIANMEGSANARFFAHQNFTLSSSGTAKTYLYGNPQVTVSQFMGTSTLFKREE